MRLLGEEPSPPAAPIKGRRRYPPAPRKERDVSSAGPQGRHHGGRTRAEREEEGTAGSDDVNDTSQCGLCGKLGQFKKQWHGMSFHGACWSAVRRCRRTLSSNKNALAESDKRSVLDRAGWRADVLPLVIKDDGSLETRRKIMLRYKVQKFQVEEKIVDKILLTRRRFAGYHQFWDGWDGDRSSRMFDRMHKQSP